MIQFLEPVLKRLLVFCAGTGHLESLLISGREAWLSPFWKAQTPNTCHCRWLKPTSTWLMKGFPLTCLPIILDYLSHASFCMFYVIWRVWKLCVSVKFAFRWQGLESRLVEASVWISKFSQASFLSQCITSPIGITPDTILIAEHHIRTLIGFHMFVFFTEMWIRDKSESVLFCFLKKQDLI